MGNRTDHAEDRFMEGEETSSLSDISAEDVARVSLNHGLAYMKQNRWQEAIEAFEQAIESNPDLAEAYFGLGTAYGRGGLNEQAAAALERAVELQTNHAEAFLNLGAIYSKQNAWQSAIFAFRKALALKPEEAHAYYGLGMAYSQSGQYPQAIKAFLEAVRIQPGLGDAFFELGRTYFQSGQYAQAVTAFQETVRIQPSNANAHYNLRIAQSRWERTLSGGPQAATRSAIDAAEETASNPSSRSPGDPFTSPEAVVIDHHPRSSSSTENRGNRPKPALRTARRETQARPPRAGKSRKVHPALIGGLFFVTAVGLGFYLASLQGSSIPDEIPPDGNAMRLLKPKVPSAGTVSFTNLLPSLSLQLHKTSRHHRKAETTPSSSDTGESAVSSHSAADRSDQISAKHTHSANADSDTDHGRSTRTKHVARSSEAGREAAPSRLETQDQKPHITHLTSAHKGAHAAPGSDVVNRVIDQLP